MFSEEIKANGNDDTTTGHGYTDEVLWLWVSQTGWGRIE